MPGFDVRQCGSYGAIIRSRSLSPFLSFSLFLCPRRAIALISNKQFARTPRRRIMVGVKWRSAETMAVRPQFQPLYPFRPPQGEHSPTALFAASRTATGRDSSRVSLIISSRPSTLASIQDHPCRSFARGKKNAASRGEMIRSEIISPPPRRRHRL